MRSLIGFWAIACVFATVGCSSKDSNDGAAGSAGGGGGVTGDLLWKNACSTSGQAQTCPGETLYGKCLVGKCDAEFKAAYGAGYQTGSFAGPCASYEVCKQACACNADIGACNLACINAQSADCKPLFTAANNCILSRGCIEGICYPPGSVPSLHTCLLLKDKCCSFLGFTTGVRDACFGVVDGADEAACSAAYEDLIGQGACS